MPILCGASDKGEERETIMRYLYHATYQALLPSILEEGLLTFPADERRELDNWGLKDKYIREYGMRPVFLAKDPDYAYDFAETADKISNEIYDSGIVVLEIDTAYLDPHAMLVDTLYNYFEEDGIKDIYDVESEGCQTIAYVEDIPVQAIRPI